MAVEQPALATPTLASASGTPKHGYNCNDCLDFQTVIVIANLAEGVTSVAEEDCHCKNGAETQP